MATGNVTKCAVCGGPGMTQCETGKWLCKRHSPYTSTDCQPQYDTYLTQKGIELSKLFAGVSYLITQLDSGVCPDCGETPHREDCKIGKLVSLTTIKTEYHPLPFFLWLEKLCPEKATSYLQDKNIFGFPSVYNPDQYLGIDTMTQQARFWSRLIGDAKTIQHLSLGVLMNLPDRIGFNHPDKFKGLPMQDQPTGEHSICPKCSGHGFWNLWAGPHLTVFYVKQCQQCRGTGWIHPTHVSPPDKYALNWMFLVKEQKYSWAYARKSKQTGEAMRKARIASKLTPENFAKRVSDFVGGSFTPEFLISVENGNTVAFDFLYVAYGEVTGRTVIEFRSK